MKHWAEGEEINLVSSSFWDGQNTATDLHFGCRELVGRGHELSNASYRDVEILYFGALLAVAGF